MTLNELTEKLAAAQTALYALEQAANNLTAEQRLEVMRIHAELGDCVYDAMTNDIQELREAA